MRYRPEIDGLRAVAIIPVVLFHAGLPLFSGGYAGVDVFFVISGYLITSIIAAERAEGTFTIARFYQRRMRRIFPALFLVIAVSMPVAWLLLPPDELKEFSGSVISSVFFYSNYFFLARSDYFATAAELKPLLHTWSLSVEEQFYVLFPAALSLTWGLGRRLQVSAMLVLALASLGLAQWMAMSQPATAFFLLPTRLWELMIGALAAYHLASKADAGMAARAGSGWLGVAGLLMILAAVVTFGRDTAFPAMPALLPTLGAVLVILYTRPQDLGGRLLGHRLAVGIGLISYSLYLWHFPLLAFARHLSKAENVLLLGGACLLAVGLSYLSWRFVERPARAMKHISTQRVFAFSGAGAGLLAAVGTAGFLSDGLKDHYVRHRLDSATRANFERLHVHAGKNLRLADDGACVFRSETLDGTFERRFEDCSRRYGKALVVLGDSHAINIHNMLFDVRFRPFLVSIARGGCRPDKSKPECSYGAFAEFAARHKDAIGTIVYHQSGSHLIRDHLGKEDSDAAFLEGNTYSIDTAAIADAAAYLDGLAGNAEVIWLGPFAEPRLDLQDPQNYSDGSLQFTPAALKPFAALDGILKPAAAAHRFTYVSLHDALQPAAGSLVIGDCLTFRDEDHFSDCGERLFGGRLAEALAAAQQR